MCDQFLEDPYLQVCRLFLKRCRSWWSNLKITTMLPRRLKCLACWLKLALKAFY